MGELVFGSVSALGETRLVALWEPAEKTKWGFSLGEEILLELVVIGPSLDLYDLADLKASASFKIFSYGVKPVKFIPKSGLDGGTLFVFFFG